MAFGCKMDNAIDVVLSENGQHSLKIANIATLKMVIVAILDIFEIGKIACVCQFVEIDDVVLRIFVDEEPNDVAADESGSARYDDAALLVAHCYYEFCGG